MRKALLALALLGAGCESAAGPRPGQVEFVPAGSASLVLGTTHTQYSADPWNPPAAVARAAGWLTTHPLLQNQHLMGWGALNPEPAPGQYDWSSLDRRIELITRTQGTPVLTLCCAPDWMKGGQPGETDWSRLEAAPLPAHYADFAELARQTALRYPAVKHFQVWNELKGFYLPAQNRWDYEGYTALYNLVYAAVKSVRPEARVGGPYAVMDSWSSRGVMSHPSGVGGAWGVLDQRPLDVVDHWLRHNAGADFVTVDLGTATRDAGLTTGAFTAIDKYRAVIAWLRGRTTLPIWLAEWYVTTESEDQAEHTALVMSAVIAMATEGAAAALQWGPQPDGISCPGGCLWSDTRNPDGGMPTPLAQAFAAFQETFRPGTPLFEVRGLPSSVTGLASPNRILLVNQARERRALQLGDRTVRLEPLEVRVEARQ